MNTKEYKVKARQFFEERATDIGDLPVSNQTLCYVSGRSNKIWENNELLDDLRQSIVSKAELQPSSNLLEVGCAAGFIANLIAPMVSKYEGVDVSKSAVQVADKLPLPNAKFMVADGTRLPYPDNSFDSSICYDVITNIPSFEDVAPIIKEMVRVTKPGGKILIGSIADKDTAEQYAEYVHKYTQELETTAKATKEIVVDREKKKESFGFIKNLFKRNIEPEILCYYFSRQDFIDLGKGLGLETEITNIHSKNPYTDYRFDVIYTKA